MKTELQIMCSECKGILFPVQTSRLEDYLGHRVYECEKCHQQWKFVREDEPFKTETIPHMPFGR